MNINSFFEQLKINKPFLGILILFTVICALNIPILITVWRHGFDDGTYSHAFLIPFISLYLYFELARSGKLQFRETFAVIPGILLLFSCYLLFITSNAQISIGYWGAFLAVLITSVIMLYRFNWYVIFPAAFLVFIFPFWGVLVPLLQNVSVVAVTYMMSFTGVPTYVEAEIITIPAGVFEIADGCSGLRYMIVSLAIGSLFIFLNIRDTKKAVLFLSLTILGALFTNWIRITALILIGEYTNMESSLMEDHNTFGWYLYVPFMILLFYWGERLSSAKHPTENIDNNQNKTKNSLLLFSIILITMSSTSFKAIYSNSIVNEQLKTSMDGRLHPNISFYSSVESIPPTKENNITIYNIYSFNSENLDNKATYYGNTFVPTGWQIVNKKIIDQWHIYILKTATQNAILKISYEIDGKKFASAKQFKIQRLIKGLTGLNKSKLHWQIKLCTESCEDQEFILVPVGK